MRFTIKKFPFVYVFALCLTGVAGVISSFFIPDAYAANGGDERLITIHDRGTERGLITRANTLREVFREASIDLDKNDLVEPALEDKLVTNNYQVNVYRARPIIIVDGRVQQLVMSAYQTPKQIAQHAGITLQDEDEASLDLTSNVVRDGASIRMVIDRATPLQLTLYGKTDTVYTQAATVADFLKEKAISLGSKDELSKKLATPISSKMKLAIWREGKQTITKKEDVDFEVQQIQDADHEVGYKKVNTAGKKGEKMVTYEIIMRDGKEVSRKAIQTVVIKKASKQIETIGTKLTNSFSGSFGQALSKLRSCEGSYTSNTGNGYYGAYQYDIQTWGNYKGYSNAAQAPPKVQDERAWLTYQSRGWNPWPSCSRSLGLQDIYR